MPLRDADYITRCSLCESEKTGHCVRCSRPLCHDHEHGERDRCENCESEFKQVATPTDISIFRTRLAQFFGVALASTPIFAIAGMGPWVMIASLAAFSGLFGSLWREQSLTRQHVLDARRDRFLSEVTRLLPDHPPSGK